MISFVFSCGRTPDLTPLPVCEWAIVHVSVLVFVCVWATAFSLSSWWLSQQSWIGIVELAVCFLYECRARTHSWCARGNPPQSRVPWPLSVLLTAASMKGSGWLPLGQLRTAVTQLKKLESCLRCHDTEHLVAFTLHSVQLYGFVCCRSKHEPCFVGLLFWWFMVWHTSYPCELIWTFFFFFAPSYNFSQVFGARSSEESSPLPSLQTSSTGTRLQRPKLRRSAGWPSSSTRSFFKTSEKPQVSCSFVLK